MSETLTLAQIELRLPQYLLRLSAIRDVLNRAEHQVWPTGCVSLHITHTVHGPYFASRTNNSMFRVGPPTGAQCLLSGSEHELSVVRVHHITDNRDVDGPLLRRQS